MGQTSNLLTLQPPNPLDLLTATPDGGPFYMQNPMKSLFLYPPAP